MQQEIRFATFNVCNLAPPGARLYENLEPSTPEEYEAKLKDFLESCEDARLIVGCAGTDTIEKTRLDTAVQANQEE